MATNKFRFGSKITMIQVIRRLIRALIGLIIKSTPDGGLDPSDFALVGGVFKATVTLDAAYTNDEYNVAVNYKTTNGTIYWATIESQTASDFVINTCSTNIDDMVKCMVITVKQD